MKSGIESVIWIVTGRCNLNCRHCYAAQYRDEVELSRDTALRLIREFADVGAEHVNFTGGEPLLREDILELLKYCNDLGIDASLFTNMTLVNEEVTRRLARLNTYTLTSLDGHNKEVFELVRGYGTWEKFIKGFSNAKKAGLNIHVNISVTELNWMYVDKIINKAVELGANTISIIPAMPAGNAIKNRVYVTSEHFKYAIEKAAEVAEELGMEVTVWCASFIEAVTNSKYITYGNCRKWGFLDISPSGKALLCDVLNIRVGNVVEEGVLKVWEKLRKGRLGRVIHEPRIREPCTTCPILSKCLSGCYARAFIIRGDLEAPDPLCPYVRGI